MQQLSSPFPKPVYARNAKIYKILANSTRLEILNSIKHRELSVEDLVQITGQRKANVSQHLALLRHAGLVETRKQGLNVYYAIVDPRLVEPCRILKEMWEQPEPARPSRKLVAAR